MCRLTVGARQRLSLVRLTQVMMRQRFIPLFRAVQLMRSRFIRGWQTNQWLMRFWRFPSVRKKCICRFGLWCFCGLKFVSPIKMAFAVRLAFWRCPPMPNYRSSFFMKRLIPCGAPQASATPTFPFIQSVDHLPRFTARQCWHGLLIIVAILMEPLIFLTDGLLILPAFPKSPNRCVQSFRLVSGLLTA